MNRLKALLVVLLFLGSTTAQSRVELSIQIQIDEDENSPVAIEKFDSAAPVQKARVQVRNRSSKTVTSLTIAVWYPVRSGSQTKSGFLTQTFDKIRIEPDESNTIPGDADISAKRLFFPEKLGQLAYASANNTLDTRIFVAEAVFADGSAWKSDKLEKDSPASSAIPPAITRDSSTVTWIGYAQKQGTRCGKRYPEDPDSKGRFRFSCVVLQGHGCCAD